MIDKTYILNNFQQRFNEGWMIISKSKNELGFGLSSNSSFTSQEEVNEFVIRRAEEGSQYHKDILAYVIAFNLRGK